MPNLFDKQFNQKDVPLAERMRPNSFSEFVGQEKLVGPNRVLRQLIEKDEIPSMIFWGPPGSGKTTLARIIARKTGANFVQVSAVDSGMGEIKKILAQSKDQQKAYQKKTILFVDEIHRFNKSQQAVFLPFVEEGSIVLIGATTENPSFEVISPLLSRCRVFVLEPLNPTDIGQIIKRTLFDKERGLGKYKIKIEKSALDFLIQSSNGDARIPLNALEIAIKITKPNRENVYPVKGSSGVFQYKESKGEAASAVLTNFQEEDLRQTSNEVYYLNKNILEEALQRRGLNYDKAGEEHYNVISAFIKSMRGSDPDAALYWLARMIEAGEDPRFIARRMIIFASEDIGNADPQAIQVAIAVAQAIEFVGLPEAQINLAQGVTYLATAPKSNASYQGLLAAKEDVKKTLNLSVPLYLRNAPTQLMKDLGYGKNYQYPHHYSDAKVKQEYLPKELKGKKYYLPMRRADQSKFSQKK